MNTPIPPLSQRLRAATRASHRRLERSPIMARLSQGRNPALADYSALLAALANPMAEFDRAIEAGLNSHPDAPAYRPRSPLLGADLAALGARPPAPGPPGWRPRGPETAGVRYVVEGAALGGAVLARQLGQRFGPRADPACAYLRIGEGLAPDHWSLITAWLDAYGSRRPEHGAAVIAGAVKAFEQIEQALEDP